jgi:hypothetical protein
MGLAKLGCFFTRTKEDGTQPDITDIRIPFYNMVTNSWVVQGDFYKYCGKQTPKNDNKMWQSLELNDGAVTISSCLAARRGSWQGKETWETEQNHEDVTCRLGNWKRACSWYGLAE